MDLRKKTAMIVTGMNMLLTTLKFFLFFVTGSLVILAEAWHSFSDIATSVLILLAVSKKVKEEKQEEQNNKSEKGKEAAVVKVERKSFLKSLTFESKVSLIIGLLLLFVSIMLIRQVFIGQKVIVQNPILAGLLFIGFAMGSYLISRFESSVGKKSQSVGLLSDSLHTRADMTASLIAGFSLILYSLKIDIDRWAALLISLFIATFSLEIVITVFLIKYRGTERKVFQVKSFQIIAYMFSPKAWKRGIKALERQYGFSILDHPFFPWFKKVITFIFIFSIIGGYISTCLFKVLPSEQCLISRFGKIDSNVVVKPGIHIKFPWPIDKAIKVNTRYIKTIPVGNVTDTQSSALIWTRVHGTEESFLSGDNYFMYPYLIVHYRIKNAYNYLYSLSNPKQYLINLSNQLLSKLLAGRTFFDLVTKYRTNISKVLHKRLQAKLDKISSGIEIITVNFKDIHPPISISDSFEEVIAASQEKQQLINEAIGYKNKNLPEARGRAARKFEEAKSYNVEKIDHAEGDEQRFNLRKGIFKRYPKILAKELHFKTMQFAFKDVKKILYDPRAGAPSIWIGNKNNALVPWQSGGE